MDTQPIFRGFPKLCMKTDETQLVLIAKAFAIPDEFSANDGQLRAPKRAHKQHSFVLNESFRILLHVGDSQLPVLMLMNPLLRILALNRQALNIIQVECDGPQTITGLPMVTVGSTIDKTQLLARSVPTMPVPHLPYATLDHISLEFCIERFPNEEPEGGSKQDVTPLVHLFTALMQKLVCATFPRYLPHCFGVWNKILRTEMAMGQQLGRYLEQSRSLSRNQVFHDGIEIQMRQFQRIDTARAFKQSDILKTVNTKQSSVERPADFDNDGTSLSTSERAQLLQFASGVVFHAAIKPKRILPQQASDPNSPALSLQNECVYSSELQEPEDLAFDDIIGRLDSRGEHLLRQYPNEELGKGTHT
ncbi:hypothetical protein FRC17_005016 [Serendipita sp. 399]|nr:hypothetical protein FRC17_005016 [Serendipita sp. 399]